ncbi:MAG: YihA family ribosome biogenesis GTP-binding protein [Chitinophagales bacterium]|nr:YihA family ribosome biogenesis GTP-binding protein [Chitinophagales bacterium]
MIIRTSRFIGSFTRVDVCPEVDLPELAFIGRSNVGKSSLINMLCNRRNLVKISSSPGKTKLLNFFMINEQFHFVDLPGYGFARVSKEERKSWIQMIKGYLTLRQNLSCAFQLIDSRLEVQKIDLDFTNLLGEWQVPFALIFTKADKQGPIKTKQHIELYHKAMKETWEFLPDTFITSAEKLTGKDEMLKYIEKIALKVR